jgi:hypothetical protein
MGSKRRYKLGINKKFGLIEKAVRQREDVQIVGFEVLTAVTTKSAVFRYITSCSPMKVSPCFGETYLHLLRQACN